MPCIVDTSNFNSFCRQIAARPLGLTLWDVIRFEIGKILERCVQLTTEDKFEKIKISVEFKNRTLRFGKKGSGPAIIYITKKSGIVWFADEPGDGYEGIAGRHGAINVTKHGKPIAPRGMVAGKTFHPMNERFRYSDQRWARYQALLAQLKGKQINVRQVLGRAGQSWVQIADSLGLSIKVAGYVRNAPSFRGIKYVNGMSKSRKTSTGIFIEMKNVAPILMGTMNGNRILQTAINGRYKKFLQSVSHNVFETVASVAKQYPGLIARAA